MFDKTRPTITSHCAASRQPANAREILDSHSDLRCRRWRPAKFRGHSVSSALPCISFHNRAEGTAGTFQRGKSPDRTSSGNAFLKSSTASPPHTQPQKTYSTQQAWMNSRNQTTIASGSKHRQPVILHPTSRNWNTSKAPFRRAQGATLACRGSFAKSAQDLGRGSRFAHALRAPRLADSASSLYTTGFPIHFTARPAHFVSLDGAR